MANVLNGNTWHVDTTGDLPNSAGKVHYVLCTPTSANMVVILQEQVSGNPTKLHVRSGSTETVIVSLDGNPIFFPTGIKAATITNAEVTIVWEAK
jgi:hypothetical protein